MTSPTPPRALKRAHPAAYLTGLLLGWALVLILAGLLLAIVAGGVLLALLEGGVL